MAEREQASNRSLAITTVVTLAVFVAIFAVVPAAIDHAIADRTHDSTPVVGFQDRATPERSRDHRKVAT